MPACLRTGRSTSPCAGNASPAWQEDKNVDLRGLAEAGMTWRLESLIHFDPLELSMAVVDAGPPRA